MGNGRGNPEVAVHQPVGPWQLTNTGDIFLFFYIGGVLLNLRVSFLLRSSSPKLLAHLTAQAMAGEYRQNARSRIIYEIQGHSLPTTPKQLQTQALGT